MVWGVQEGRMSRREGEREARRGERENRQGSLRGGLSLPFRREWGGKALILVQGETLYKNRGLVSFSRHTVLLSLPVQDAVSFVSGSDVFERV